MHEYQISEIPPANSIISKRENTLGTETYLSLRICELPENKNSLIATPHSTGPINPETLDNNGNIHLLSEHTRNYIKQKWLPTPIIIHYLLFDGKLVETKHQHIQ